MRIIFIARQHNTRDIDIAITSVRPSVRLFVRRFCSGILWKRLNLLS